MSAIFTLPELTSSGHSLVEAPVFDTQFGIVFISNVMLNDKVIRLDVHCGWQPNSAPHKPDDPDTVSAWREGISDDCIWSRWLCYSGTMKWEN